MMQSPPATSKEVFDECDLQIVSRITHYNYKAIKVVGKVQKVKKNTHLSTKSQGKMSFLGQKVHES